MNMYIELLKEQKDLRIQLAEVMFQHQLMRDEESLSELRGLRKALSDVTWAIKELELNVCNYNLIVN